jgi:hypothetical protein
MTIIACAGKRLCQRKAVPEKGCARERLCQRKAVIEKGCDRERLEEAGDF